MGASVQTLGTTTLGSGSTIILDSNSRVETLKLDSHESKLLFSDSLGSSLFNSQVSTFSKGVLLFYS